MADEEYDTNFNQLLGSFGAHANIQKRQKAERLAAMEPDDDRRKKAGRSRQFNARITDKSFALAHLLIKRLSARDGRKWSGRLLGGSHFRSCQSREARGRRMIWRALVIVAGLAVVGAATHANVMQ